MYCKFEYTGRYKKLNKVFDYIYYAFIAFMVIIAINNIFINVIDSDIALDVLKWVFAFFMIFECFLEFYKIKCISLPSIDFTLQYNDINKDDPLQAKVMSQAVSFATSWADFALKREKSRMKLSGVYKLTLSILIIISLIVERCYQ